MRWLLCRSGHLAIVFSINWLIRYVHVYFTILSFFISYFKLRAIDQITVRIFDIFVVFYLSQEFKMVLSSIVNQTKSVRNLRVQSQIGRIILSNVRKRTKASEIGRWRTAKTCGIIQGKSLWRYMTSWAAAMLFALFSVNRWVFPSMSKGIITKRRRTVAECLFGLSL